MVLLTVTPAAKLAIDAFVKTEAEDEDAVQQREKLAKAEIGGQIEHHELVNLSRLLVQHTDGAARQWRLDTLLKGSTIYQPPPPPKPEPVG